jgi:ankyrin repeat protein
MSDIIEALEENNLLKVKQAIKNGADLNQMVEVGEDDEYMLLFFALRQHVSCDVLRALVDAGADISYLTHDGVGILDEAIIFADMETLRYLTEEKNLDITQTKRKSGFTPFMQACCYGKEEVVEFILKKGINIEEKDKMGMNALDYLKRLRKEKMHKIIENLMENS